MNLSKNNNNLIIGIIGLGYVGLPLAIEFGKKFKTIGFDIKKERIKNLSLSIDTTSEVNEVNFKKAKYLKFSNNSYDLINCNIYIITVPTPIYNNKKPDLRYIKKASEFKFAILWNKSGHCWFFDESKARYKSS